MFITSVNDVFSVCSCYEILPHVLANRFCLILNVVTKTWYKKCNSVLEYNASPSYDDTSGDSGNRSKNWTTEEECVYSRQREDILPFCKASRLAVMSTEPTIQYSVFQSKLTVLFSLNLQMVYSNWSWKGCGVAVMFVILLRLMLEDCAVTLTSGIVWSAEIQQVTLSFPAGLLCV